MCMIEKLKENQKKNILVIGDVMIDEYIYGASTRLSPEAPVPVVKTTSQEYRLGGATNVCLNLAHLDMHPTIIGVKGDDQNAKILESLCREAKINTHFIIDYNRYTTIKRRIMVNNHQMLRLDTEHTQQIPPEISQSVVRKLHDVKRLPPDAVIVSDYQKGVCTQEMIYHICETFSDKLIMIDTKNPHFYLPNQYQNVILKVNKHEAECLLEINSIKRFPLYKICQQICAETNASMVMLTLGDGGLCFYQKPFVYPSTQPIQDQIGKSKYFRLLAHQQQISDVSGAGDTTVAVFTIALLSGCDYSQAATLANLAGGVVAGKVGINTVTYDDLKGC